MSYIQLIEKVVLPTSVWLTFWDLEEKSQVSLEIATPTDSYEIGAIFSLDRDANFERLALKPVTEQSIVDSLNLLLPSQVTATLKERPIERKSVSIRENIGGVERAHNGFLSLVG